MSRFARRPVWSAAVLAATAALAAPAVASAAPVIISQGHVDVVDVAYENGALAATVHDESVEPSVERDPASVRFVVKREARTAVPNDPAFAFLGSPGSDVWLLPQVQDPGLLFPGFSTEEIQPGALRDDSLQLKLKRVIGPGDLAVFTSDPFGAPQIRYDSGDGLPDSIDLPVGTHEHDSWGFERSGLYCITFEATARRSYDGRRISTGPVTLYFRVQR